MLPHVPYKSLAIRKRKGGGKSEESRRVTYDGIRPIVTGTSEVETRGAFARGGWLLLVG